MSDSRILVPIVFDARGDLKGAEGEVRRVGKAADTAKGKVGGLGGALGKLVAPLLGVAAAAAAVRSAFALMSESLKLADVQRVAESKLDQALVNVGEGGTRAAAGLRELASETQRVSNYGDEAILTAQAMLLSFRGVGGSEGAGILTQSLVDMAAGLEKAGGEAVDLNNIAAALGKSLIDGASALKRFKIDLSDSEEAAFNAAEGLDRVRLLAEIVEKNYGGMAEATIRDTTQMQNAIGDLKEEFGKGLNSEVQSLAGEMTRLAQDEGVIRMVRALGSAAAETAHNIGELVSVLGRAAAWIARLEEAAESGDRAAQGLASGFEHVGRVLGLLFNPIKGFWGLLRQVWQAVVMLKTAVTSGLARSLEILLTPLARASGGVARFVGWLRAAQAAADLDFAQARTELNALRSGASGAAAAFRDLADAQSRVVFDEETGTYRRAPGVTEEPQPEPLPAEAPSGTSTTARDNERRVEEARDLANRLIDLGEVVKEARRNAADAATLHAIRMSRERLAQLQVEAETEARLIRDAEERERTLAGVRHAYRMQSIALDRRQAEAEEAIAVAASERERDRALVEARRLDTARERAAAVEVAEAEHQTRLTEILRDGEHARAEIATASAEAQAAFAAESSDEVERIYQEAADRANAALQEMEPPPLPIEEWERQLRDGLVVSIEQVVTALQALDQEFATAKTDETREKVAALIRTYEDLLATFRDTGSLEIDFADALNQGLGDALQTTAQLLGEMASGADASLSDLAATLGAALGDMLVNLGKTALLTAVGIAGIKKALTSLNPVAAAAAGVALIAFGSYIKGKVAQIGQDAGSGGGGGGDRFTTRAPNSARQSPYATSRPASGVSAGLALGYGQGSGYGGSTPSAPVVNVGGPTVNPTPVQVQVLAGPQGLYAVTQQGGAEVQRRRGTGGGL